MNFILVFKKDFYKLFSNVTQVVNFFKTRLSIVVDEGVIKNKALHEESILDYNLKFVEGNSMTLVIDGVIGSGKSSLTEILADKLGTRPFYEPVDDNPVLPLFYDGNKKVDEGVWESNPYAFLLQVFFLNRRFKCIKEALTTKNAIMDRSIYGDKIFAKMNYDKGTMTDIEWDMYQELLENMMEETKGLPKKSPDLLIMIKVSYDTMIKRIQKRGREFEQLTYDASLEDYYKDLITRYNDWLDSYDLSPVLVIDGDKYDFMNNQADRVEVLSTIYSKLYDLHCIDSNTYDNLISSL